MVRFIIEQIRRRFTQAKEQAADSKAAVVTGHAGSPSALETETTDQAPASPSTTGAGGGDRAEASNVSAMEAGEASTEIKPRSRRRRRRRRPRRPAEQPPSDASLMSDESWDPSTFVVEPAEGKTRFQDLSLHPAVLHAISDLGYQYCTPIQAELLPHALAGKDALGKAQTGTGKTAAFLIAIYQRFLTHPITSPRQPGTPRALIVAPTRELVMQLEKDAAGLGKYTGCNAVAVYGGIDYAKQRSLLAEKPVDILIATPGRLLDFKKQRTLHLQQVEILVLDEADRMLDMGFIPDVRQIVLSTPKKHLRQTMFFSATFNADVHRIGSQWTRDPVFVEIEPEEVAVKSVEQRVYIVTADEKFPLLLNLIKGEHAERVMVFANRRDQTRKLADLLHRHDISCAMLSGDVPQAKRIQTLEQFKEGNIRVLVATDVAGRGIHVEGVSHVVNFTLPQDPEDYVHRIGRTGRAGATGTSISFACEEDSFHIPAIEAFLGQDLQCIHPDEAMLQPPPPPSRKDSPYGEPRHPRRRRPRSGQGASSRSGRSAGRRHPRRRSSRS